MSYLDHLRRLNRHDMNGFRPLFVAGREVGWVRHAIAERLAHDTGAFEVGAFGIALHADLSTPQARSEAVMAALSDLVAEGLAPPPRGELYAVAEAWGAPTLFHLDRAHVPLLGVRAHGVHLNGIVRRDDGLHLWVARRASDRIVEPGKLDNMVAGGQPAGLTLAENLARECDEEASLPRDLAAQARPVGLVSYCMETEAGLKPDTLFLYDLELPEDFTPRNRDGEIDAFMLWPTEKVLETVRNTDFFKFNVNLVVLDFAIRHGLVSPDDEPDYATLVMGLRRDPVRFHPDAPFAAHGQLSDSAAAFPG